VLAVSAVTGIQPVAAPRSIVLMTTGNGRRVPAVGNMERACHDRRLPHPNQGGRSVGRRMVLSTA
jgi:hypothetical protein